MKAQALRGSTKRGFAPGVFRGLVEQVRQIIESKVTLGSLDSCAGQEPDHLVEKPFATEGQEVALRERREGSFMESPLEVGFRCFVAPVGGKGPEIVAPTEEGEGVLKGGRIELAGKMPGPAGLEGRKNGSSAQLVVIGLGDSRKTRMKVIRNFLAFQNPDSSWELGVKSGHPVDRVHGEFSRRVKVSDLAGGVDA